MLRLRPLPSAFHPIPNVLFVYASLYSTASITAFWSPRRILGCHDCGISFATTRTWLPQYRRLTRHDTYLVAIVSAFQLPRRILDRHDANISIATVRTCSLRLQHSNCHGAYLTASMSTSQSPRAYLLATISAFHSYRRLLADHEYGIPTATPHTRSPR